MSFHVLGARHPLLKPLRTLGTLEPSVLVLLELDRDQPWPFNARTSAMLQGRMPAKFRVCAKVRFARFTPEPALLQVDVLPDVAHAERTLQEHFATGRANK